MPGTYLHRKAFILRLQENKIWDIIIIGGGATGLGIAVDAASRGLSTILFEQQDFAGGTSSRSTKLIHGGVRYLAQGKIKLVYSALRERGYLLKNASHLVKKQSFIIPCYNRFEKWKYFTGLKIYDWLSGKLSFGSSTFLSAHEVSKEIPGINTFKLRGGIKYFDGQFDDARLAINLAQTAAEEGAVLLNYFRVADLIKTNQQVSGVIVNDTETGIPYNVHAKAVINATGVFVDDILSMNEPMHQPLVRPSQGTHIVLQRSFLGRYSALMIPKTADGRVLFAIPWNDYVLAGTTDTPVDHNSINPHPLTEEIDFILGTLKDYFVHSPSKKDILSVFAGLRPLAATSGRKNKTKEISRDHKLLISDSGLITITGGKWTTYRKMAEETVDKAIMIARLPEAACKTKQLKIHGGLCNINLEIAITGAVRYEMARTIEDVLARRLRILFLNAEEAIRLAPLVAGIIAAELGYDENWKTTQLDIFKKVADQYLISSYDLK